MEININDSISKQIGFEISFNPYYNAEGDDAIKVKLIKKDNDRLETVNINKSDWTNYNNGFYKNMVNAFNMNYDNRTTMGILTPPVSMKQWKSANNANIWSDHLQWGGHSVHLLQF
jgi:hypothetical protein